MLLCAKHTTPCFRAPPGLESKRNRATLEFSEAEHARSESDEGRAKLLLGPEWPTGAASAADRFAPEGLAQHGRVAPRVLAPTGQTELLCLLSRRLSTSKVWALRALERLFRPFGLRRQPGNRPSVGNLSA